jgi:hypothetical protein
LIELYQGGPDCGLDLIRNMTQKPHEAHRAQPVTTEEETYNKRAAMVQEQGLAHKQVMSPSLQEADDDQHKGKIRRQGAFTARHQSTTSPQKEAVARSGRGTEELRKRQAGALSDTQGCTRSATGQARRNGGAAPAEEADQQQRPSV